MSDGSIKVLQNALGDRLVDNETVTGHTDGTVYRQRVELAGALLAEIAAVKNTTPDAADYALAVRLAGAVVTNATPSASDYALAVRLAGAVVTGSTPAADALGLVTRSTPNAVRGDRIISQYLTTTGIMGGTFEATGNYSGGSTQFYITPGVGKKLAITRLLVSLEDSGSLDSGSYGNGITLANGIKVEARDGVTTLLKEFTDGNPIKTNADWGHYCYDVTPLGFGTGNEHLVVRWTIAKSGKELLLEDDDRFTVILEDDFTGLIAHGFIVQGYWIVGP